MTIHFMIITYYEKNSQNLHAYPTPITRDTPMFAEYVSAGYLVMKPDIHFRISETHTEMLEGINLAIDKVEFIAPVFVGDVVSFYTATVRVGKTSVRKKAAVSTR